MTNPIYYEFIEVVKNSMLLISFLIHNPHRYSRAIPSFNFLFETERKIPLGERIHEYNEISNLGCS